MLSRTFRVIQRRCQCPALLLGANAAGGFKLKPMLIHYTILKILEPLRIMLNLLCICFINETTNPGWQLLPTWFTEYFDHYWNLLIKEKKRVPFILLKDNEPSHPRSLMEITMRLILVSCQLTLLPFCSPWIK